MEFIDTPGLHASNTMHAANKALLRKIKAAHKWHKPNYVFYVDRLDATRPSLGELTLLGLINESLGAKVCVGDSMEGQIPNNWQHLYRQCTPQCCLCPSSGVEGDHGRPDSCKRRPGIAGQGVRDVQQAEA